jgi:hypothetical protein
MDAKEKAEALAMLKIFPEGLWPVVSGKSLDRAGLIREVQGETKFGHEIVKMHQQYLKYLKENPIKE